MNYAVNPGITPKDMSAVWESAIEEATENPSRAVSIHFAPGTYPLPDSGVYLYKKIPTPLHVRRPGANVIFVFSDGQLHVDLERKDHD